MSKCATCGKPAGFMNEICTACLDEMARKDRDRAAEVERKAADLAARANAVQLTTAQTLAAHRIIRSVDIVVAEYAVGLGFMQGIAVGFTEGFGGESGTTQSVLAEARTKVLTRLRRAAAERDANAVIAIDLDYSEFSSGGKPIIFLVASGTAVAVEMDSTS